MKDLNSPFKLERLGMNTLGETNFLTLSPKAKIFFQAPLVPKFGCPYCHRLVWVGGSRGEGGPARHVSAPHGCLF